ncbi:MAG: hypothetical protein IPO92_04255 [Saprospiraceae bacterium]|nr:hypothetical protein [Saprospiraceae bacterium]
MINTFSFSYPWWYLLICVALGILYALLMYYRDKRFSDYSHWFTKTLGLLRTAGVSLIALLLLNPFVKTIKEDTKSPVIILATDNSTSIKAGEKPDVLDQYQQKLTSLGESLEEKYDVKYLNFGTDVTNAKKDSFTSKSTNISNLFDYIENNYSDQNLGAIIMGTDGIYNEGSNPIYNDSKFNAPLYTIALGDTTQKKDLLFQNILYNKIAYLGDKFSVQVDISAFNCASNNTKVSLEMISGNQNKKIVEETLLINSNNFFTTKTFLLDASQSGVIRFRAKLASVPNEYNTSNNVKEFFIEILDARQKILLLANAPHPDLAALKSIITSNKNYEVELAFAKDFTGNYSKYNLVLFHNLPSDINDIGSIIAQLDKNNTPRIFIVGMQTSLVKFNKSQEIVQIIGNSRNQEDIQVEFNSGFSQFTTTDALKSKLKSFPPLVAPFGDYKSLGTGNVFLYQNIKKIKTNYPLISFGEKNGFKTCVINGEGIWKWRLFDHLQNKNYDLISELVNKTIQLTSVKADKRKFRASTSKNLYTENEAILFDAQLYNDSYEMVNESEVKLVVKDENNKEFTYIFSKTSNYYTLNADIFAHGSYTYTATTNYNGKALTVGGKFNVEAIQLEQFDLTAKHALLKTLSEKHLGKMVYPSNMETLKDILLNNDLIKPVMYQTTSTKSIIYLKWLFFVILTLLSLEWFLRRYFGNY